MLHSSRTTASKSVAGVVTAALTGAMLVATAVTAPVASASPNVEHGTVSPRPSDQTISFVDGVTYSIAQVGGKVFVGGTFTQVGPGVRGAAGLVNVAGSSFGRAWNARRRRRWWTCL